MMRLDLSEAEQYCTEPSPLATVQRAFARVPVGEQLEVSSRVREHVWAVRVWARREALEIDVDDEKDGTYRIVIRRGAGTTPSR